MPSFKRFVKLFSCSGLVEVEVEAETQTEAEAAAKAVAPVLF